MSRQIGVALAYLRSQGLTPVFAPKGERHFEGALQTSRGPIRICLMIRDWDFIEYPAIVVLDRPSFLPLLSPHLMGASGLCYFTPGSVILDRFHPENALAQCLAQAQIVLDKLVSDPHYRQSEFVREFAATWSLGQVPMPYGLLLGNIKESDRSVPIHYMDAKTQIRGLISNDSKEAESICMAKGWPPPLQGSPCWQLISDTDPLLPPAEFPKNVREMFAWLRSWSPKAYRQFQSVLGTKEYLSAGQAIFLIRTPAGKIGFSFKLDAQKRAGFKRNPSLYRQYLHRHGDAVSIDRISITEIGSDFVHSRNLRFASLKDKRVVLIGCGAIGGYLAQALAKLGAGSGVNGRLNLIDPDQLQAENIGRHYLGFDHLFSNKAEAVRSVLHAQFPSLNIEALPRMANFSSDLKCDLIINATGDQALSEALNYYHCQLPGKVRPPLLHSWVYGNGECVQSLWVDDKKHACYRCLKNLDRTPRFEISRNKVETRIVGCNVFTPYTVGVSLNAAGLAADHVASWLNGDPSPRFRTRVTENHAVRLIKSQDVSPLKDCPACATTNSA